jgi:O-antigen/teichoic acid export membrane protein
MLAVLTKTVPADAVGQFSLGLAIAAPILMFSNFQLRSIQATDHSSRFGPLDYLAFRGITSAAAFLIIVLTAALAGYSSSTIPVIIVVGLYKCIESLSDGVYGHLQRAELMGTIAISMLLKGLLSVVALVTAITLVPDILSAGVALSAVCLIMFTLWDLAAFRALVRRDRQSERVKPGGPAVLFDLARLGLPLAVTSALLVLATNVPRYFLERSWGQQELGYFAALAYPMVSLTLLVGGFCQAATPRLASFFASDRVSFWRLVRRLMLVPVAAVSVALAIGIPLGRQLLSFVYRNEYAAHHETFLILIGASGIWALASVLGYAVTAAGQRDPQAPAAALVCLVAVTSSAFVIPRWGIEGVEWARAAPEPEPEAARDQEGRQAGRRPATVVTSPVVAATINDKLSGIGTGRANASVSIKPYSAGRLTEVLVEPGARVGRGEVLARLDSEAEEIAVDRARFALDDAQARVTRVTALRASSSTP